MAFQKGGDRVCVRDQDKEGSIENAQGCTQECTQGVHTQDARSAHTQVECTRDAQREHAENPESTRNPDGTYRPLGEASKVGDHSESGQKALGEVRERTQ